MSSRTPDFNETEHCIVIDGLGVHLLSEPPRAAGYIMARQHKRLRWHVRRQRPGQQDKQTQSVAAGPEKATEEEAQASSSSLSPSWGVQLEELSLAPPRSSSSSSSSSPSSPPPTEQESERPLTHRQPVHRTSLLGRHCTSQSDLAETLDSTSPSNSPTALVHPVRHIITNPHYIDLYVSFLLAFIRNPHGLYYKRVYTHLLHLGRHFQNLPPGEFDSATRRGVERCIRTIRDLMKRVVDECRLIRWVRKVPLGRALVGEGVNRREVDVVDVRREKLMDKIEREVLEIADLVKRWRESVAEGV